MPVTPEIICYFTDPDDMTVQKVKSHRCDFNALSNNGTLRIYVPEEINPISSNKDYKLTITTRFAGGF